MASAYCWAESEAAGILMLLLDDGTEPIPECHSGMAFPENRTGQLCKLPFKVAAGEAAEVHLMAQVDLKRTCRATVLLRGRRAAPA